MPKGAFQPPKSKVIGLWFNTYINNAKEITVVTDIVPIYNIFEVLFLFLVKLRQAHREKEEEWVK